MSEFKISFQDADIVSNVYPDVTKIAIYGFGMNKPAELVLTAHELNALVLHLQCLRELFCKP